MNRSKSQQRSGISYRSTESDSVKALNTKKCKSSKFGDVIRKIFGRKNIKSQISLPTPTTQLGNVKSNHHSRRLRKLTWTRTLPSSSRPPPPLRPPRILDTREQSLYLLETSLATVLWVHMLRLQICQLIRAVSDCRTRRENDHVDHAVQHYPILQERTQIS